MKKLPKRGEKLMCIDASGHNMSLTKGKTYEALEDCEQQKHGGHSPEPTIIVIDDGNRPTRFLLGRFIEPKK